jgi:hypothetical protein
VPFIPPFIFRISAKTSAQAWQIAAIFEVLGGFCAEPPTLPPPNTTPTKKPPQWVFAAAGGKVHSGYSGDRKTLFMKNG